MLRRWRLILLWRPRWRLSPGIWHRRSHITLVINSVRIRIRHYHIRNGRHSHLTILSHVHWRDRVPARNGRRGGSDSVKRRRNRHAVPHCHLYGVHKGSIGRNSVQLGTQDRRYGRLRGVVSVMRRIVVVNIRGHTVRGRRNTVIVLYGHSYEISPTVWRSHSSIGHMRWHVGRHVT